jgi:hypothetical protein
MRINIYIFLTFTVFSGYFFFSCDSIDELMSFKEQVFIKTYGGAGSEEGFDVKQTADGGFIIVGTTTSFGSGGKDVYLVRTDPGGNQIWQKSFGGPGNDTGRNIQLTSDGGFIICGDYEEESGGIRDIYLIKTDGAGNLQTSKRLGLPGRDEMGVHVISLPDGGYFVTGNNVDSAKIYLAEIDGNLNPRPGKEKSGIGQDGFLNLGAGSIRRNETRFFCFGTSTESDVEASKNSRNYYFFEFDPLGESAISPRFYGTSNNETATSVIRTPDQGFLIGGYAVIGGREQPYLVKTNINGLLEWEVPYTRAYSTQVNTRVESVLPTQDGGYIAVVTTSELNLGREIGLIKFDPAGVFEWQNQFGSEGDDFAGSVVQLADGSYVIAGSMAFNIGATITENLKMTLIKVNKNGQLTVE